MPKARQAAVGMGMEADWKMAFAALDEVVREVGGGFSVSSV